MNNMFARVLRGSRKFNLGNINDTYIGQIVGSDGQVKKAVIKDIIDTELANEMLSAYIARELELPVPDFYMAASSDDIDTQKAPNINDVVVVFASAIVEKPNFTRAVNLNPDLAQHLFSELLSWPSLGGLYAFDGWLANTDRHGGNLLFGGKSEVFLIDHGHCFTGSNWKPEQLIPSGEYLNKLAQWLTCHMSQETRRARYADAANFAQRASKINVAEAVTACNLQLVLPDENLSAMTNFVQGRLSLIGELANKALNAGVLA